MEKKNYFNALPWREALLQLGHCRSMERSECGAQGLNQGLNLRDSGLNVSYALRKEAIAEKRASWKNATDNGFTVGTYEELIPDADVVGNLTPDKQHSSVLAKVLPLMKKGSVLWYSHGFNIVEEGMSIRPDITVVMMAPKGPGSELRTEYVVHAENDPEHKGLENAKALAFATGASRAGVLESSFIAEVKSDLMGEQTILCGVLQSGSLLCFDKMVKEGIEPGYAAKLVQYGWETLSEAMKWGGVTGMMNRLSNPAKLKAHALSKELKAIMSDLYKKQMDDIISGVFSATMMQDWADNDADLLKWREETGKTAFERTDACQTPIREQEYFDKGILMAAILKAGVELAFETMTDAGIKAESAYYESLHEVPLIANLISRKKLYEMNKVISDTAEYGCYLFNNRCRPLLADFMSRQKLDVIGKGLDLADTEVDNAELTAVNAEIQEHPVEIVGKKLRAYMTSMKALAKKKL